MDKESLRHELAVRGWTATDLAREARLSLATVASAVRGQSVSPTSLSLIARTLAQVPPDPEIQRLLEL